MPAPPDRRSTGFLLAYALANAGGTVGYLPLLTLLLPMRIEQVAPDSRLTLLATIAIVGAVAASVANIAVGWLSDRTLDRGIGRRWWMAGGLVATTASYGLFAAAGTASALIGATVVFQLAINALLAPLAALMADEVPDAQKGVAGGLLALAGPVASATGAALVAATDLGDGARLAIVPAVVAAFVLPLLATRARPVAAGAARHAPGPERRDLAIAWAARLLVQIAGVVLSLYLLYDLEGLARGVAPSALAGRVGRLVALCAIVALPAAVLLGRLSDRIGRRKPFLLAAAALAALGLTGMALAQDWAAAAIGFGLYSVGAAVFLALHAGFATQLLPDPRHRGRDLGLVNLTNTLPSIVGPGLAWLLATPRDFSALLLVLAGLTIAGGLAMMGVRGRS